jgi:phosphoribosylamine--glycine ligase
MNVLITGSGAREHALALACAGSREVDRVYVAPGNGGTTTNVPIGADDAQGLARFAVAQGVGLAVLGPESSVAAGVGDALRAAGVPCFGPDRAPGQIETSKAFAKRLMELAGIPTPAFGVFDAVEPARAFARRRHGRVVIKADGLAGGKGVLVCGSVEEAERAIEEVLVDRAFGAAGDKLVVEERLAGPELSLLALTDGREVVPLAPARDYKRALDGDRGLNTGGMGAYSPPRGVDRQLVEYATESVLRPAVRALAEHGLSYRGVLYAGLMLTSEGPRVLEFNCRFGDPEAQVVLRRLRGDLVPLLLATAEGRLAGQPPPEWDPRPAVGIVIASGGYPGEYRTGLPIHGLEEPSDGASILHAGTRCEGTRVLTSGGRVLTVVASGDGVAEARASALAAAARVGFAGAFHRSDIAKEAEGTHE